MSQQINALNLSLKAGADLSGNQFYFVKISDEQTVALAGAGNGIGVLQNKPKNGETALVTVLGTAKVIAGGAITAGDFIVSDANGKAVVASGPANARGIALEFASAGDIIEVLLLTSYVAGS